MINHQHHHTYWKNWTNYFQNGYFGCEGHNTKYILESNQNSNINYFQLSKTDSIKINSSSYGEITSLCNKPPVQTRPHKARAHEYRPKCGDAREGKAGIAHSMIA